MATRSGVADIMLTEPTGHMDNILSFYRNWMLSLLSVRNPGYAGRVKFDMEIFTASFQAGKILAAQKSLPSLKTN
jgi:hypothetical protein